MTFLPIVERELRVAARRRGTYGMRMKIAGAATIAFAACFVASQVTPSVHFGKSLFTGLSVLCMIYCLAAGRLMTADCLSREKREGTLGLLFLTDLKGYDVVLGKLAATSLDGFYGLLAVFPLLAIPLLAGGMTNGELWRMAVVLVNTFLFSLAIGLFVSAVCRDEQKAMAANFGLVLLLAAAPPVVGAMFMNVAAVRPRPMIHEFFYSCPVYSFLESADAEYKKSPVHFWQSIGITFNLTILLVLLACRVAPRAWQDKPLAPRSGRRKGERRRRWWREGRMEKAHAFRQRLLAVNAYFWLAARPYLKVSYVWTCVLSIGLWWVFITLMIGHTDEAANFGMAFLLNGMLKLWIITEAGHQLAEDKRSGAFEILLSTPLTVGDIVRGQWQALRRQFLKPVVAAVVLELLLMFSISYVRTQDKAQAWSIWLAGILMLLADVITLGWAAMSAALTEKNHDRATLTTAAFLLALPWLLFGAVNPATSLWMLLISRKPWEPAWTYYLAWWFGLGVGLDLLFLLRAKRRVQTSFRQLALESPASKSRFAWLQSWRNGSPEQKPPLRAKLRRLAIAGVVLLAAVAGAVLCAIRALHVDLPKPVVVLISQSNHPLRVFAGQGGFLFILPDGTLWRWVHPWGQQAGIFPPQQVGTNRDWVQASVMNTNAVGLRSDGTLWAWAVQDEEPSQVGSDHDWVEARASGNLIIARKRDGTLWANGSYGNPVNGAFSGQIIGTQGQSIVAVPTGMMVQVGTNRDWKAISTTASSAGVLVLRADQTLWTWGDVSIFANGIWSRAYSTLPVQVCRESNWIGLSDGFWGSARNQAGEWWSFEPFACPPGADVPVSAIGQLASSNSAMAALGPVFSANWSFGMYDIQPGGTMWATPLLSWPVVPPLTPPVRFGRRSDWVSVWGGSGTIVGLTSDATLWTWGIDYGQERHFEFGERLGMVKAAISNAFGSTSRPPPYDEWQGYQPQKEPRPLLRLSVTN
jgi:ABC-type transport system involved in multi-copper enzyme maturation permease subunit